MGARGAREALLILLLIIRFSVCLRGADWKDGQRGENLVQARDRVLPAVHNIFFFSFSTSFSMVSDLDCSTREDGEVKSFQLFSNEIITDEHSHAYGTCPKNKSLSAGSKSTVQPQTLDIIPTCPKRLPSTNVF